MRPCMSPWPLVIPVDGPTAWLRSTWMASSRRSRRSSMRLCCSRTKDKMTRRSHQNRGNQESPFYQAFNHLNKLMTGCWYLRKTMQEKLIVSNQTRKKQIQVKNIALLWKFTTIILWKTAKTCIPNTSIQMNPEISRELLGWRVYARPTRVLVTRLCELQDVGPGRRNLQTVETLKAYSTP